MKKLLIYLILVSITLLTTQCKKDGATGPIGPEGATGPQGPQGTPGSSSVRTKK